MRPVRNLLLSLLLLPALAVGARADLGPLEPVADLHRALHDSLGLPEPMIVRLLERGLPEPELPVAGLVARRARVPVERVADLRLGGASWHDISLRLGPGPAIFYVPFEVDPGPPYGNAWGHFKKTPRDRWRTVRLTDVEIVHLANLKLVADHHRIPPARVVELHRGGKGYAVIHRDLHAAKAAKAKAGPAKSAKPVKASASAQGPKAGKAVHGKGGGSKPKGKGKPPGH